MTDVPVLTTERLVLNAHTQADFAESAAIWGDADVTRFIGGKPSTPEEVWSRLVRYAGHWALMGFGYWAVRERGSGRLVGDVGFADWRREIDPPFDGAPEGGWVLAPWSHGRGYASEAVAAACAWADDHFGRVRLVCMIAPENQPSLNVAARAGFVPYAQADYKGSPSVLLERLPR